MGGNRRQWAGLGEGTEPPSSQVHYKPLELELAQLFMELAGEVRRGRGLGVSGQMMLSSPFSLKNKTKQGYPETTLHL